MNVIAVMGSPFQEGNVASLVHEVTRGARDAGHTVKEYDINEMNVRGCQGCRDCKNNNIDCILEDDLKPYWEELHNAGALIVGAPNYASNICGPMITFMNRHYCLIDLQGKSRLHYGVKLVGVFSQGRDNKDEYLKQYDWYLKDFENRDMIRQDVLINTRKMPEEERAELMKRAYELGKSL